MSKADCDRRYALKHPEKKAAKQKRYWGAYKKKHGHGYYEKEITCTCGKVFWSTSKTTLLCKGCKKEQARVKKIRDKIIARRLGMINRFVSVKEINPYVDIICKGCGVTFSVNFYANTRLFHSRKCSIRYLKREIGTNHRQRCRHFGVPYTTIKKNDIYERDNYICGICGYPIDKMLKWPDMMSISIDHIIPLSAKGSPGHIMSNVQAAHFICNSNKSDGMHIRKLA
jgi:hypothetical protein